MDVAGDAREPGGRLDPAHAVRQVEAEEQPTRDEDALDLEKRRVLVAARLVDVLEHTDAEHGVEAPVGERQLNRIRGGHVLETGLAGHGPGRRFERIADRSEAEMVEEVGEVPVAAPPVEHARRRVEVSGHDRVGLAVLGVGGEVVELGHVRAHTLLGGAPVYLDDQLPGRWPGARVEQAPCSPGG